MPPLRRTHLTYPFDDDGTSFGTPGIWFELTTAPGFVGLAQTDWPPVREAGTREERRAGLEADLNAVLQAMCEKRIKFASMVAESTKGDTITDEDPITKDLIAEPFCRFEDVDGKVTDVKGDIDIYVVRVVEIFVPVESINPVVLGTIEVSNAASQVVRV